MMGPRSMGAGTQRYADAGRGGGGPTKQQRTRTHEPDVDNEIPSSDRETKAKVALTPAQRLIERYERMSTPPLPSPSSSHSHRIPPGSGTVGGTTTTMMRAKSTRSRQYVYDYRTASASALDDGDDGNGNSNKRDGGGGNLKKDRSPIRQSLKNLFSVFKKGAGGLTKLAHHHGHGHGHHGKGVADESALLGVGRGGGVHPNEIPSKDKTNVRRDARNPKDGVQQQQQQSQALPRKKMTGPLLYLSRQTPLCDADSSSDSEEDVQAHPKPACNTVPRPGFTGNEEPQADSSSWAWSTCSVTLEEGKLVVSCFTGDLELYVREIALTRCVDIRSLSTAQLEAALKEEGILVEKSIEDKDRDKEGKVFEMTFSDGRPKERFAAKSVRERAGWISVIWDAILPSRDIDTQQPEGASSGEGQERDRTLGVSIQEKNDSKKLPVESPTPTPLPKMSSLLLNHSQYSSSPPPPSLPSKDRSPPPSTVLGTHIYTDAAPLPLTMPKVLPLVPHKKPPELHLDLSEFAGPMSPPSVYPPTIISPSTGPSRSQNEVVISPSIYGQQQQGPPSSRPASIFVASPISCLSPASALSAAGSTGPPPPPPHSPSIRNLSQLSVVRQRLAQIQRNHSALSGDSRSRYSYAATTPTTPNGGRGDSPTSSAHLRARARGGLTPLESPVSLIGSGWSRSETVFHGGNGKGKGKARSADDDDGLISPRTRKKDGGQSTIFHDEEEERQDESESPNPKTRARTRANSHSHSHQNHRPASVISPSVSPGKQKHAAITHTCTYTGPSKEDIQRLSKEVNSIKNVLGGESGCSTVHEMVFNLEQRMRGSADDSKATREKDKKDSADLRAIKDELKVLGNRVSEVIATNVDVAARIEVVNKSAKAVFDANAATAAAVSGMRPPTTPTSEMSRKDDQAIIQALNEVKNRLSVEFPALAGKLQDIKDAQHKEAERQKEKEKEIAREKEKEKESKVVTMNNVARSSSVPPSSGDDSKAREEYKVLLEKLEEIHAFCQAPNPALNAPTPPVADMDKAGDVDLKENLNKILSLIQEDSNKQTLLSQQQGDSVRYLNELNSWLEAFVNNGTSQIQGISNNIERLCNEIGCTSTNSSNGRSRSPQAQPNLVNDIRQLVAGMKARDQNFTALQAAVHSLLEVLTASQAQHGADSQAIAGLMDRQRHDQEAMFRAFTNEISGEIKGERLRFVDAMKEATAINVQLHVEQFKQELNKEVMAMTEEVGRLHREKQIVENQISDLFSFYSKHKKAEMPLQVIPPNTGMPVRNNVQEAPRANIPRSNRQRALPPHPRYDQH